MAIIMGQCTVPSSSTINVFTVPAGTVSTIIFMPGWASTVPVYIGSTSNLTSTNGMPVPSTPCNIDGYISVSGTKIWATTGSATASSFSYLISTGA